MTETDLQLAMQRRIRTHMLVSIGGVLIGFLLIGATGAATTVLFPGDPGLMVLVPLLGIALIPIVGFTSTYKNLRCPSCEGSVAWQVSAKYSLFGGGFSNDCRHCKATIFSPLTTKRFVRMMLVMAVAAVLLGLAGAVANGFSAQRSHDASPPNAETRVSPPNP